MSIKQEEFTCFFRCLAEKNICLSENYKTYIDITNIVQYDMDTKCTHSVFKNSAKKERNHEEVT